MKRKKKKRHLALLTDDEDIRADIVEARINGANAREIAERFVHVHKSNMHMRIRRSGIDNMMGYVLVGSRRQREGRRDAKRSLQWQWQDLGFVVKQHWCC